MLVLVFTVLITHFCSLLSTCYTYRGKLAFSSSPPSHPPPLCSYGFGLKLGLGVIPVNASIRIYCSHYSFLLFPSVCASPTEANSRLRAYQPPTPPPLYSVPVNASIRLGTVLISFSSFFFSFLLLLLGTCYTYRDKLASFGHHPAAPASPSHLYFYNTSKC